jgi:hypothetical protein
MTSKTGFVYYFPKITDAALVVSRAKDLGLGGVLDSACSFRGVDEGGGPDGQGGMLASLPGVELVWHPTGQTWRHYGGFWLGWPEGRLPEADDLRRVGAGLSASWRIRLSNGQEWEIASAPSLPRYLGIGSDGKPTRKLPEAMRDLAEMAERVDRVVRSQNDAGAKPETLSEADEHSICVRVLGLLYHVSKFELDALEALSDRDRFNILLGFIDHPLLSGSAVDGAAAEQKKKGE